MMKKNLFVFIFAVVLNILTAQDFHFSQFYNTPLTTNPALTGMTEGGFRVGAIYRNQWWNSSQDFVNTSFSTPAVFVDAPIYIKNSALGLGLVLLNDRVAGGLLNDYGIAGSISYILGLGKNKNHLLSFGLQGNYTNRNFSNNLQFASQFQNNEFNASYGTPESLKGRSFNHFDANAGLVYLAKINDKIKFNIGVSVFNIAATDYGYIQNNSKDNYRRFSGQIGGEFAVAPKVFLLPSILFMQQGNVNQMNSGLALGYGFNEKTKLYLGAYARSAGWVKDLQMDAVIAYAGLDINRFKVGLSYDYTVSGLRKAPKNTGAVELSLIYTHARNEVKIPPLNLICPRF